MSGNFWPRGKLGLQLSVMYCFVFVVYVERPRETQKRPGRPREARRGPERPREAQRGPEKPREPQRSTETHREAQRGSERRTETHKSLRQNRKLSRHRRCPEKLCDEMKRTDKGRYWRCPNNRKLSRHRRCPEKLCNEMNWKQTQFCTYVCMYVVCVVTHTGEN